MADIFEDKYESEYKRDGVWKVIKGGTPDYQSAKDDSNCYLMRLDRRIVDYYYEKLYVKKDSHRHWVVAVKYGSKILYLNTTLEEFSDWFFSDSILVNGGHAWEYRNRKAQHAKYRNRPK